MTGGGPLVTAGLAGLGGLNLVQGLWAWLAPGHFYDTFPGFGQRWPAGYPPYNAHLVTDLGATFVTFGVLLLAAAALRDRRVTVVVLVGVLGFSVMHLAFHLRQHGELDGGSWAASLATLVLGVLAPAVLLVLARRQRR